MRKYISISFFLLLSITVVNAQHKQYNQAGDSTVIIDAPVEDNGNNSEPVEEKPRDTLFIDTTVYYNQLQMSPDSVEAWKNQKAFGYVKNLDSLLKARQQKDNKKENEAESSSPGNSWLSNLFSSGVFQMFLWLFAIAFVLFILYHLFLAEGAFRKKTKSAKSVTPDVEEEVITSESDFEIMIRQAVQSGNYRLAVRYQYLQTLHKLADKHLISLANDKTNYQYVREITNQNYQNDFAALTLNYEYVWYGEFAIEENIYRRMETGFSQFNTKL